MDAQSISHSHLTCTNCNAAVKGRQPAVRRNGETCTKIFCNRACYDEHRRNLVAARAKPCSYCGKLAHVVGGKGKASQRDHYCNAICWKADKKAKPKSCLNCKTVFTPIKWHKEYGGFVSYNAGKTCSAECHNLWIRNNQARKEKISAAFQADKHPNWQGGTHRSSGRGPGWQKIRREVIRRAGNKCEHCGLTAEAMLEKYKCSFHINHIVPFHQHGGTTAQANRLSNLEALCRSCHTKADWKWRKENPVQLYMMGLFDGR